MNLLRSMAVILLAAVSDSRLCPSSRIAGQTGVTGLLRLRGGHAGSGVHVVTEANPRDIYEVQLLALT